MIIEKDNSNGLIINDTGDNAPDNANEAGFDTPNNPEDVNEFEKSQSGLTNWEQEPTITGLKEDLEFARAENQDQKANVAGWLDIRNATGTESGVPGGATPGKSRVQPKLVRKHNEWRYPSLSEPFLNSERMYELTPRTFEDKAAADQNETILNWQFDTQIAKVDFIDRYVRTVVDEGTCIFRVGWDKKTQKVEVEEPVYSYFEIQDQKQLEVLNQIIQLRTQDPEQYEALEDDVKAAVEYSMENNRPVYAEQTSVEKSFKEVVIRNQPCAKIIKVANFFYDVSCEGVWEDSQFALNTYESTRSDLKKQRKFKNLKKVNWAANQVKANLGTQDHTTDTPDVDSRTDDSKIKVLVYEYWGLFDIHNTGEMVPIVVTWIGDIIIQMDLNPFPDQKPPFVVVPYMPILDSIFGEADASLLQDNQRVLGAVTRGTIDLIGRAANAQTGYAKNFLDPINRRRFSKGEDFEFSPNADPRTAIQQMKYPELPNSALQVMAMQNQEAEGLSGIKSFSQGITGDAFGKVARGISGATDSAKQREMSIIRRLGEGMRLIGIKFSSMNAKFLSEEEVVRVTNEEFVKIKREDLAGNFDIIVDISTASVDEAKANDLGFMLQTVGPNIDPNMTSIILAEIADLKRMPSLAEQIRTYQPQPDPLAEKLKELEIRKLEVQLTLDEAKIEELTAKAANIRVDTELDASGTRHDRATENQGAQASGNRDLEVTKSLLEGNTPAGNIEAAVGFNELVKPQKKQEPGQIPQPQQPDLFPGTQQPTLQDPNLAPIQQELP